MSGVCFVCQSECDDEDYLCPLCDALHDVIEDGDNAAEAVGNGAWLTEEREQRIAMAMAAGEELEERRGTSREKLCVGEGSYWLRAS